MRFLSLMLSYLLAFGSQSLSLDAPEQLLAKVSAAYAKLEPQSIRPSEGFIRYDYLIPAGYYKQMWDWDGFFIGVHLANESPEKVKYLKWWVLNFANAVDEEGYVAGCITTKGPRSLMGKFAMKPFLAQGAVIASEHLDDYEWVRPVWDKLQRIISYRERTQLDPKYGLFFWENAMSSGADNNVALTNDPTEKGAMLAVDLSTFQFREYKAMAALAKELGKNSDTAVYNGKAERLRAAMLEHLWSKSDAMFFNMHRKNGELIKRVSYSNFVVLIDDILPRGDAQEMIRRHLWNPDEMLSPHGLRSLSKQDREYNNVSMIDPYSNWQGPVWINANYIYYVALKHYGFDREARELARVLGRLVLADIAKWGSMHENYSAETGEGLAPTPDQSPGHVFVGFVGWNLLVEDMLRCEVRDECRLLN